MLLGAREHGPDPLARERVVFLFLVATVHGVRVLLLPGEGEGHRAFVGEYGHESWVWCVRFSPAGTMLVSGGGNYAGIGAGVRIWDAR